MQNANNDETITTCEAAKLLKVSTRTVQLWVENDTLAAWKTSGSHPRIILHEAEIREKGRIPKGVTIPHKDNYQESLKSLFNEYVLQKSHSSASL